MMALKLYVWADPYPVPYGTAMVFAVAENLREARKVALADGKKIWAYSKYDNDPVPAGIKLGKPDRVLSLPCAEWHEWSE